MEQLKSFQGLSPESQGQNLALTVLFVPYSLDSAGAAGGSGGVASPEHAACSFSEKKRFITCRTGVQGLLENQGTHRPRTLRSIPLGAWDLPRGCSCP